MDENNDSNDLEDDDTPDEDDSDNDDYDQQDSDNDFGTINLGKGIGKRQGHYHDDHSTGKNKKRRM
jgi:hypothetical protein